MFITFFFLFLVFSHSLTCQTRIFQLCDVWVCVCYVDTQIFFFSCSLTKCQMSINSCRAFGTCTSAAVVLCRLFYFFIFSRVYICSIPMFIRYLCGIFGVKRANAPSSTSAVIAHVAIECIWYAKRRRNRPIRRHRRPGWERNNEKQKEQMFRNSTVEERTRTG